MQHTVVVVDFYQEMNAPATTEDKSDDAMGNFMRYYGNKLNLEYTAETKFLCIHITET
jgi:hypothetical protein